jgi:hypothetical protein
MILQYQCIKHWPRHPNVKISAKRLILRMKKKPFVFDSLERRRLSEFVIFVRLWFTQPPTFTFLLLPFFFDKGWKNVREPLSLSFMKNGSTVHEFPWQPWHIFKVGIAKQIDELRVSLIDNFKLWFLKPNNIL